MKVLRNLLCAGLVAAGFSNLAIADDVVKELPGIETLEIGDGVYFVRSKLLSQGWQLNVEKNLWEKDAVSLALTFGPDGLAGIDKFGPFAGSEEAAMEVCEGALDGGEPYESVNGFGCNVGEASIMTGNAITWHFEVVRGHDGSLGFDETITVGIDALSVGEVQ